MPEFIPLVSSTQNSDSDVRPRNSREHLALPSPRRISRERIRRISPPPLINNQISPHRRKKERRSHSHSPPQKHSPRRCSSSNLSRTNSSERTTNRSVFNRLGVPSQKSFSPINYEGRTRNSPIQSYSSEPLPSRLIDYRGEIDFEPVRIVVKNDNYQGNACLDGFNNNRHVTANDMQAEIIYSIRQLERKNYENLQHIHGVRMTVENYHREIYKLEQIVEQTAQEIERLKARLNSIM